MVLDSLWRILYIVDATIAFVVGGRDGVGDLLVDNDHV
jgi:hypothetical protein